MMVYYENLPQQEGCRERERQMREKKIEMLAEFFRQNPRAALGFSGGVDSAWLLYAGIKAGAEIQPYYIRTAFQPDFELRDAKRLCGELGTALNIVELDIFQVEEAVKNPHNRCYYCKKALFGTLKEQALRDGFSILLDGTNASDDADDRPGMQAARELSVRSPLRECGITKVFRGCTYEIAFHGDGNGSDVLSLCVNGRKVTLKNNVIAPVAGEILKVDVMLGKKAE